MKTAWCSETASKSYIDTVRAVKSGFPATTHVAELVSAMAGGFKCQLIIEAWARGDSIATSVGLAIASRHVGGRHVCIVPDERWRLEYEEAMQRSGLSPEVVVGEAEEVMGGLVGVDFVVVDSRRKDFAKILRFAKMSQRGAVLVCKNAVPCFRWRGVLGNGTRVVRSVFLPIEKGLEIAQVSMGGGVGSGKSRWIKHFDRRTGEEHVFLR
ncbi:ankyrin repeat/KH domain protein (DUF1442) [Tasmannia lanceolata]|uniref:ankyrin repeat/KH domain protein (DUF1442) n=1 Tax=Tasmannia lanceolata TaxID=3420 RepID=UPI00406339B6